jgi:hypothetical protein
MNALLYKAMGTTRVALGNRLMMSSKGATKVYVDAAVSIGQPLFPCQSNTRKIYASTIADLDVGKQASARDHHCHRASVRASMTMSMTAPLTSRGSWRTGKVTCSLKDCATQRSSPMQYTSLEFIQQCHKQVECNDQIMLENLLLSPCWKIPPRRLSWSNALMEVPIEVPKVFL